MSVVVLDLESLPKTRLASFCQRHGIRRLAIFGSTFRGDFKPDSDIDVLVEFESGRRVGLSFFTMQDELSAILGREVDLNTPGFLARRIRRRVLQEARDIHVAA